MSSSLFRARSIANSHFASPSRTQIPREREVFSSIESADWLYCIDPPELSAYDATAIFREEKHITIITSPEHIKRSVLTFKKLGFSRSNGYPAFHRAIESDIKYENKDIGGKKYLPDVGNNVAIRYRFWTHLKYEILIMREFLALFYYKLNGWI